MVLRAIKGDSGSNGDNDEDDDNGDDHDHNKDVDDNVNNTAAYTLLAHHCYAHKSTNSYK